MEAIIDNDIGNQLPRSWDEIPVSASELDPRGIPYEILRWSMYREMIANLTQQVQERTREHGYEYTGVIAPLRGGYWPGVEVARVLGVPMIPIGVETYTANFAGSEALAAGTSLYVDVTPKQFDRQGRLLVVDDVNHTSKTVDFAVSHITQVGGIPPDQIDYAVIHEKPTYRRRRADFVVRFTDAWIVYAPENSPERIALPNEDFDRSLHNHSKLHYDLWEFHGKQFPTWMVYRENGGIVTATFEQACARAKAIGFHEDELPSLADPGFRTRLTSSLEKHIYAMNAHLAGQRLTITPGQLLR